MTVLLLILLAIWLGVSLPAPLQGTPAESAAQALKEKMDRYVPPRRKARDGEAGA